MVSGSIVNIGLTVKASKEIIPSIPAAHSVSGCDTVAPHHGVGKASIVKNLTMGKELKNIHTLWTHRSC